MSHAVFCSTSCCPFTSRTLGEAWRPWLTPKIFLRLPTAGSAPELLPPQCEYSLTIHYFFIEFYAFSGNNVVAYKSSQSSVTNQTGPGEFKYEYNSSLAPSNAANVNAARVNAFYIVNTVHDFAYRYGFTEEAYNFQNDNHGKGGVGGDRVLMSVQDSSGTNNANFATPPEYVLIPCVKTR